MLNFEEAIAVNKDIKPASGIHKLMKDVVPIDILKKYCIFPRYFHDRDTLVVSGISAHRKIEIEKELQKLEIANIVWIALPAPKDFEMIFSRHLNTLLKYYNIEYTSKEIQDLRSESLIFYNEIF